MRLRLLIAACVWREGDVVLGSEDARLVLAAMVLGLAFITHIFNEDVSVWDAVLAYFGPDNGTIVDTIINVCISIDHNIVFAIFVYLGEVVSHLIS